MITKGQIDLEGLLKPKSIFPEDNFTLKGVTVDSIVPNLEKLHGWLQVDPWEHQGDTSFLVFNPTYCPT